MTAQTTDGAPDGRDPRDAVDRKLRRELSAGSTALVLLAVLGRAGEPLYGYRISKLIEWEGNGAGPVTGGALYPVLRSLERSGLLASSVEPSVAGPPRRYYRITGDGRAALARWTAIWRDTVDFVDSTLKGTGDERDDS